MLNKRLKEQDELLDDKDLEIEYLRTELDSHEAKNTDK